MREPTLLDDSRADTVCKKGQGEATCSFLVMGAGGSSCTKGSEFERAVIERRPTMRSKGDNCSGPPDFRPNENPMAKTQANMTNLELWRQVAARKDLIGGDVESREGGDVYRGPLKSIKIVEGRYVKFDTEWSATRADDSDRWVKHDIDTFFTDIEGTRPTTDGDGTVRFSMQMMGPVILFPKGPNNLNPALVEGLRLAEPPAGTT